MNALRFVFALFIGLCLLVPEAAFAATFSGTITALNSKDRSFTVTSTTGRFVRTFTLATNATIVYAPGTNGSFQTGQRVSVSYGGEIATAVAVKPALVIQAPSALPPEFASVGPPSTVLSTTDPPPSPAVAIKVSKLKYSKDEDVPGKYATENFTLPNGHEYQVFRCVGKPAKDAKEAQNVYTHWFDGTHLRGGLPPPGQHYSVHTMIRFPSGIWADMTSLIEPRGYLHSLVQIIQLGDKEFLIDGNAIHEITLNPEGFLQVYSLRSKFPQSQPFVAVLCDGRYPLVLDQQGRFRGALDYDEITNAWRLLQYLGDPVVDIEAVVQEGDELVFTAERPKDPKRFLANPQPQFFEFRLTGKEAFKGDGIDTIELDSGTPTERTFFVSRNGDFFEGLHEYSVHSEWTFHEFKDGNARGKFADPPIRENDSLLLQFADATVIFDLRSGTMTKQR